MPAFLTLHGELVRLNVDVIMCAASTQGILAAKNATTEIRIVFAGSTDLVALESLFLDFLDCRQKGQG